MGDQLFTCDRVLFNGSRNYLYVTISLATCPFKKTSSELGELNPTIFDHLKDFKPKYNHTESHKVEEGRGVAIDIMDDDYSDDNRNDAILRIS